MGRVREVLQRRAEGLGFLSEDPVSDQHQFGQRDPGGRAYGHSFMIGDIWRLLNTAVYAWPPRPRPGVVRLGRHRAEDRLRPGPPAAGNLALAAPRHRHHAPDRRRGLCGVRAAGLASPRQGDQRADAPVRNLSGTAVPPASRARSLPRAGHFAQAPGVLTRRPLPDQSESAVWPARYLPSGSVGRCEMRSVIDKPSG
jgi:hypothetical protein